MNRKIFINHVSRSGKTNRRISLWALCLLMILVSFIPATCPAQEVPETSQVPIFFKLLTYDRTLWETPRSQLRIGILHREGNDKSQTNRTSLESALDKHRGKTVNKVPFEYTAISWREQGQLVSRLQNADVDVIYVTSGHLDQLEIILAVTRNRNVLTITGSPDYVLSGLSAGLILENGQPRLEVNLKALEAEGHQLDARVLKLCKVVDR